MAPLLGNLLKEKGRSDLRDELKFYRQWFSTLDKQNAESTFPWKRCSLKLITIALQVRHELNRLLWADLGLHPPCGTFLL